MELSQEAITTYLSHGISYGKWLELCNQGKYAIIMPAMQAHYQQVRDALKALLR